MARALVPDACAFGPTATESVPVAKESGNVELAWKYLIPAPFAMALNWPAPFVRVLRLLLTADRLLSVVLRPVDSELRPVEVEVDRLPTLLLVVLRPVDNELTPVDSELTPVDSELRPVEVEVDRLLTLLLVVLKPVDSELMPVEADVDSDVN